MRARVDVSTFSGTNLPPIARVGNSADAVHTPGRNTSISSVAVVLVRPSIVRSVAPAGPVLEFAPKRRPIVKRSRSK
jgi:hypothetical protein